MRHITAKLIESTDLLGNVRDEPVIDRCKMPTKKV